MTTCKENKTGVARAFFWVRDMARADATNMMFMMTSWMMASLHCSRCPNRTAPGFLWWQDSWYRSNHRTISVVPAVRKEKIFEAHLIFNLRPSLISLRFDYHVYSYACVQYPSRPDGMHDGSATWACTVAGVHMVPWVEIVRKILCITFKSKPLKFEINNTIDLIHM